MASIQKRTSPIKFAHMAEKSEKGSISNFSTKAEIAALRAEIESLAQSNAALQAKVDRSRIAAVAVAA